MRRLLFDLEGNGLLPDITKIHCIAACDVDTLECLEWGPKEIPQAFETLATADRLIAHNGLSYDFRVMPKFGFTVPVETQIDTLVLSRLMHPNLKERDSLYNKWCLKNGQPTMGDSFGSHSIEAWGIRLKCHKKYAGIEDWSVWTPEMQERCAGDVQTALRLWQYLNPDKYSVKAMELEHRIARLCLQITDAGWPFNVRAAVDLQIKLVEERTAVERELIETFKGWEEKTPFTPKVNNAKRGYVKGVPTFKTKFIPFNPNSRQHIARAMKELGWQPKDFTESGQPVMDEEVIEQIAAEFPQAEGFTKYLLIDKRIGQLADGDNAWLKLVGDDERIHAQYNPMGAVTSRASHYRPNIAQVPAGSSPYGHECRELFYAPEGWEMVGADMSGLEGRCFAHYLHKHDGGAYGEALLEGDPHWAVVNAVGFIDGRRDKSNGLHTLLREQGAKRLFYAMLYGAGDEKAGRIILDACRAARKAFPDFGAYVHFFGEDETPSVKSLRSVGATAKRNVVQGIDGFEKLKTTISYYASKGYLPGLDNRRLPVRSDHAALNTLLQSAGAILCKQWLVDAFDALLAEGLKHGWDGDFVFLGWIHDEVQVACRNGLGDRIGRVLTCAAQKAGEPFGFRIRLDSEYKIGKTWADTH